MALHPLIAVAGGEGEREKERERERESVFKFLSEGVREKETTL